MLDLAALATTVVSSFLWPYAKKGLEKIGEEVGKNVSESAAKHAVSLTEKIWARVEGLFQTPKEKTALELFQDDPNEMKGKVEKMLREKLEQDEAAAKELSEMANAPGPDGATTGAQIMQAGIAGIADLRQAHIAGSGNVVAGVIYGGTPQQPPTPPKPAGGKQNE